MREFVQALRATLRAVVSDQAVLTVMVGAVLLYSVFYPAAYRHQVAGNLAVVVVDQDHSAASRQLLRTLQAVRAIRVAEVLGDPLPARDRVARGQADGIVLIPAGFQRDILRGQAGHIVLQGNGAWLGRASSVLAGAAEAITGFAPQAAVARADYAGIPTRAPVAVVQRPLFNTREGYGSGIVPGVAELIVHQTLLIGIGALLGARRARDGRRLQVSPAALLGMGSAFAMVGLGGLALYAGVTFWVQDYPRGGNFTGLVVAGGLFVAATVAFGLWLGSFFRDRLQAFQYITASSMLLFFLANLSWPASSTPDAVRWLARLVPTTAGINAMVQFNQMGARLSEVTAPLWTLLGLLLLYVLLAWQRLGRRHAMQRPAPREVPDPPSS